MTADPWIPGHLKVIAAKRAVTMPFHRLKSRLELTTVKMSARRSASAPWILPELASVAVQRPWKTTVPLPKEALIDSWGIWSCISVLIGG